MRNSYIRIFGIKQFLNYGDSSGEVTALKDKI